MKFEPEMTLIDYNDVISSWSTVSHSTCTCFHRDSYICSGFDTFCKFLKVWISKTPLKIFTLCIVSLEKFQRNKIQKQKYWYCQTSLYGFIASLNYIIRNTTIQKNIVLSSFRNLKWFLLASICDNTTNRTTKNNCYSVAFAIEKIYWILWKLFGTIFLYFP